MEHTYDGIYHVHRPDTFGESYWFYEGIEDRKQRRAIALLSRFGSPGGGDLVVFAHDLIIIASPEGPGGMTMELCVRPLDDFLKAYGDECRRQGDDSAMRWVDKIAEWPDLGC
jgi:hypothetical protein